MAGACAGAAARRTSCDSDALAAATLEDSPENTALRRLGAQAAVSPDCTGGVGADSAPSAASPALTAFRRRESLLLPAVSLLLLPGALP